MPLGFASPTIRPLFLAAIVLAGCSPASSSPAQSPPPSNSIELTPGWLDLGNVAPGYKTTGTIEIRNRGTTTLRVARIETSCPCVDISPSAFDLASGESRQVEVRFDGGVEPDFQGVLAVRAAGLSLKNETLFRTSVGVKVDRNTKQAAEWP